MSVWVVYRGRVFFERGLPEGGTWKHLARHPFGDRLMKLKQKRESVSWSPPSRGITEDLSRPRSKNTRNQ